MLSLRSHRTSALVSLAFFALVSGCGGNDSSPGTQPDNLDPEPIEPPTPTLPTGSGACPAMTQGVQPFLGKNVLLHVPPEGAPTGGALVFYWHGSGSNTGECSLTLKDQISQITAEGGVVACMDGGQNTGKGDYTGPFEWYSADYDVADEVVACAREAFQIDPARIHALGMSAGGLQTSQMVLRRSYLASAVSISGGCIDCPEPPDPTNKIPVMFFHGSWEKDLVVIHFYDTSRAMENVLRERGQFVIDCDHGGGHMVPPEGANMWRFLNDHPYKTTPEPYESGLPAGFPSYCQVVTENMPLWGQ